MKEQGASVSLMCVLHVYVHEFVCLFSECFACVLTRVCIIILGCFIMCRLCRHQAIVYYDVSSPFSQLYGTACLSMADLSHRCWCLLMTHLQVMIGMSQLQGSA